MQVINSRQLIVMVMITAVIIVIVLTTPAGSNQPINKSSPGSLSINKALVWEAPDTSKIPFTPEGSLIRYGRDLIANTSVYLGPKGKIAAITNGMNCQNCHLEAGTRTWGNNYSAVFSTYPRFRERSGTVENIYKRVNDCIERSLNGHSLDTNGREMQAISAYIKWLGQKVPKNVKPSGAGIADITLLDRSANPVKGQSVYTQKCQRCHGTEGKGLLNADSTMYVYPPLWGSNSYNTGAGLYRISRFAGYVKDNMPFDAPYNSTGLTDEEAWDLAAFVNSQPRPQKDYSKDWPTISGKPFDHPFGPYADNFSEEQHKYGPFGPIKQNREKMASHRNK
jgi:thiosulfate dehydrogenase